MTTSFSESRISCLVSGKTGLLRFAWPLILAVALNAQDYTCTTNKGALTITGYRGPGGAVTIASKIYGLPVTGIGEYAFFHCSRLTSLVIPDSVTSISGLAFLYCSALTDVTIPGSVTSIGDYAFVFTGLKSVTIPDSVTNLGDCAFQYCTNLSRLTLGGHIGSVGPNAFDGCTSLASVTIPDSVASIGDYAFRFCSSLTNLTIGNSVGNIGKGAFAFCSSLRCLKIPNSVAAIGDSACCGCTNLADVAIGANVTDVGCHAFDGCTGLVRVTVPNSVTNIGEYAFGFCNNLKEVYFKGDRPQAASTAFAYDNNLTVYYLPDSCGWDCSFAGCPTEPWSLPAQISGVGLVALNHQFGFTITGLSNRVVIVEACTNLANPVWCPLQMLYLNGGSSCFSDPQCSQFPGRFYRLRSQ